MEKLKTLGELKAEEKSVDISLDLNLEKAKSYWANVDISLAGKIEDVFSPNAFKKNIVRGNLMMMVKLHNEVALPDTLKFYFCASEGEGRWDLVKSVRATTACEENINIDNLPVDFLEKIFDLVYKKKS